MLSDTVNSCFKNPVFPDEGLAHSSNIVHNVPQDLPSLFEDSALVLGNRAAEILTAINIGAGFGVAVDEFEAVAGGGVAWVPFVYLLRNFFFGPTLTQSPPPTRARKRSFFIQT